MSQRKRPDKPKPKALRPPREQPPVMTILNPNAAESPQANGALAATPAGNLLAS
jgi:hypothetical protein